MLLYRQHEKFDDRSPNVGIRAYSFEVEIDWRSLASRPARGFEIEINNACFKQAFNNPDFQLFFFHVYLRFEFSLMLVGFCDKSRNGGA